MTKIEFILKFGQFYKDPLGNIGCSDENIWGYYNKEITVGKTKEEAAKAMVDLYNKKINSDSTFQKELFSIGWTDSDVLEIPSAKIKNIYLSILANSRWLDNQDSLAPIGREYLLKEFFPSSFWATFYKTFYPHKKPIDYNELFSDIRLLKEKESFEFHNYNIADCIREGFYQVYSTKSIDELKATLQQARQFL